MQAHPRASVRFLLVLAGLLLITVQGRKAFRSGNKAIQATGAKSKALAPSGLEPGDLFVTLKRGGQPYQPTNLCVVVALQAAKSLKNAAGSTNSAKVVSTCYLQGEDNPGPTTAATDKAENFQLNAKAGTFTELGADAILTNADFILDQIAGSDECAKHDETWRTPGDVKSQQFLVIKGGQMSIQLTDDDLAFPTMDPGSKCQTLAGALKYLLIKDKLFAAFSIDGDATSWGTELTAFQSTPSYPLFQKMVEAMKAHVAQPHPLAPWATFKNDLQFFLNKEVFTGQFPKKDDWMKANPKGTLRDYMSAFSTAGKGIWGFLTTADESGQFSSTAPSAPSTGTVG